MREIKAISSKSDAHRALICQALSPVPCEVRGTDVSSEDIEASRSCLRALREGREEMYCGESGSTFRFLLPVMGALGRCASFYTKGRLSQRPLSPLYEELAGHGCLLSPMGAVPFVIRGKLRAGEYTVEGGVSSQYISGLLFALPLLEGDSFLRITGRRESAGYIEMTLQTLRRFGILIEEEGEGYFVRGRQTYRGPKIYEIEGDWSNAAFWLTAGAFLEEGIRVRGLRTDSLQGDKEIVNILKDFGARVEVKDGDVCVSKGRLRGIEIDAGQIPDLIPPLSVLAAGAKGETVVKNARRLRLKESDRLCSIAEMIRGLGGDVEEREDGLLIRGGGELSGGGISSFGDHRIAMAGAIASLICRGNVRIEGSAAAGKSYPRFFEDLQSLRLDNKVERR